MISRGDDWGVRAPVPVDAVVCGTDRAASDVIATARRVNHPVPPVLLTGGSLFRTLGGRKGRRAQPGTEVTFVECNVGEALLDGKLRWFVAHAVLGGGWMSGRLTVVANAAHLGRWNIAPRAHPGDDLLDVVEPRLTFQQRVLALRRLPSGTHLPHPDIRVSRVKSEAFERPGRGTRVTLDGGPAERHRNIAVRIADFRLRVYVA